MQGLKYIEPGIRCDAELKIRSFYYTPTLSFSLAEHARDKIEDEQRSVLFYFIKGGELLESIHIPIEYLLHNEEVWVERKVQEESAHLYATDVFDRYSYFLKQPF